MPAYRAEGQAASNSKDAACNTKASLRVAYGMASGNPGATFQREWHVSLLQKEIAVIVHMPDIKRLLEAATIPDGDSSAHIRRLRQGRDR